MLCSKLHCQKGFNLILFSEVSHTLNLDSRAGGSVQSAVESLRARSGKALTPHP